MKVLAIGAHFDDIELGCGGAVADHRVRGDEVIHYVATESSIVSPEGKIVRDGQVARAEGERAARVLGVETVLCGEFKTNDLVAGDDLVCSLLKVIEDFRPDLVYTHWEGDGHLDHHHLARASISAARHVPRVLAYQSNYHPSASIFQGTFFKDITSTMSAKKAAIQCFESEMKRAGEKWLQYTVNKDQNAGCMVGVEYAECFQVIRFLG